jgi:putative addiction module component (TIGR02574 family)
MAVNLEELGLDQLSIAERLELIEQLWNSLPAQIDSTEIPAWHLAELRKRRVRVETTPGAGKPWREVLDRLESGS